MYHYEIHCFLFSTNKFILQSQHVIFTLEACNEQRDQRANSEQIVITEK